MSGMVGITKIITAQITIVEKMSKEESKVILENSDAFEQNAKVTLKDMFNADDVLVEVQDFVKDLDKEDGVSV